MGDSRNVGRFALTTCFLLAVAGAFTPTVASQQSLTLVLPLRTIGVSDTTAAVVGQLLRDELLRRGMALVPSSRSDGFLAPREEACDHPECANATAVARGASRVIYGSLSRLGNKVILSIHALWVGEPAPDYSDQLTASTEEDLDTVVRRVAESLVAGRQNADQPTIDTVTQEETLEPRRRASRSGLGLRAGFLFPVGNSYGDVDRLTSLRLSIRYETRNFHVESTPLLAFAWRGETMEWTPFDLFVARIFGVGDFAPYVGAGLGISALHVEQIVYVSDGSTNYRSSSGHSETTLAADIGAGLLALRTYDFVIVLDFRYHYVFTDFDDAHGVSLRLGISR